MGWRSAIPSRSSYSASNSINLRGAGWIKCLMSHPFRRIRANRLPALRASARIVLHDEQPAAEKKTFVVGWGWPPGLAALFLWACFFRRRPGDYRRNLRRGFQRWQVPHQLRADGRGPGRNGPGPHRCDAPAPRRRPATGCRRLPVGVGGRCRAAGGRRLCGLAGLCGLARVRGLARGYGLARVCGLARGYGLAGVRGLVRFRSRSAARCRVPELVRLRASGRIGSHATSGQGEPAGGELVRRSSG